MSTQSPTVPVPGMKVVPEYFGTEAWEILHGGMWATLCEFMLEKPGAIDAFERETGLKMRSLVPRSPMDALVDQASGYRDTVMAAWCDWVTKNCWGEKGKANLATDERE